MRHVQLDALIRGVAPETVHDSVVEFGRYPELAPHVQFAVVHQTQPAPIGRSSWVLHFRSGLLRWTEQERFLRDELVIEFEQHNGDFDEFTGCWTLHRSGDDTELRFAADFDFGIPSLEGILDPIAEMSADYAAEMLSPVEEFALRVVRDEGDFTGGVAIFTIVIEGVLAPAAELSECKWDRLDPAASEIARGAAIDEIRHLTVGSSIIRDHLIAHPEYRPRLLEILAEGERLWEAVPDRKYVMAREELFQQGMAQRTDLVGDYEIWPGRRMLDTMPEERYDMAERWTDQMAEVRMAYMGLDGVLSSGRSVS